jgi:hypothetical protein
MRICLRRISHLAIRRTTLLSHITALPVFGRGSSALAPSLQKSAGIQRLGAVASPPSATACASAKTANPASSASLRIWDGSPHQRMNSTAGRTMTEITDRQIVDGQPQKNRQTIDVATAAPQPLDKQKTLVNGRNCLVGWGHITRSPTPCSTRAARETASSPQMHRSCGPSGCTASRPYSPLCMSRDERRTCFKGVWAIVDTLPIRRLNKRRLADKARAA